MFKASLILLVSVVALCGCTSSLPRLTTMADSPGAKGSAPARAPVRVANVRVPAPDELMGKDPDGVRERLGNPSLLRKEGDAQVWQYAGSGCVVFLYLYDNAAGAPQVTYLDARGKSDGAVPVGPCLNDVVRTRAAAGLS